MKEGVNVPCSRWQTPHIGAQSGSLLLPTCLSSVRDSCLRTNISNLRQKPRGPGSAQSHPPRCVLCIASLSFPFCQLLSSTQPPLLRAALWTVTHILSNPCPMTQTQGASRSLNLSSILHSIVMKIICMDPNCHPPHASHTPMRAVSLRC